jgi:chromosome segregation ATPase
LEKELADLRDKYDEDMSGLRADHQMKIEEFEEELDILETENNRIRNQLLDTERELSEVTSNYDRDQALWQDKFAFLESQKNQAKKDLQDAHQKFEMTIEQLHRKDSSERGKTESAQMLLISSIEKKYKDQIKDMAETHAQAVTEANLRYRQLEKEYKELREKYELEARGKISDYGTMERKIKDLLETEHRLQEEVKNLKNDRDRKLLETQSRLEQEKEIYKQKILEMENRAKTSESKRSFQIFEFEKERAKWTLEKDKLLTELEQVSEQYKKTKARKDKTEKEMEKLKNDLRSHRKFMYSGALNSSNAAVEMASEKVKLAKAGSNTEASSESKAKTSYQRTPKYPRKYIGDYTSRSKYSAEK